MKASGFPAIGIFFPMLLLIVNSVAWANSNFVTNPYLPYPPSCARMPATNATAIEETGAIQFFEGKVSLPDQQTFEQIEFVLKAYRSPCSEAGRSLVWLEFSLSQEIAKGDIQVMLPLVVADHEGETFGYTSLMSLVSEPNSWGSGGEVDRERMMLLSRPHDNPDSTEIDKLEGEGRNWWFLLDNQSPLSDDGYYAGYGMPASAYNAHFTLRLRYPPDYNIVQIEVPSMEEMSMSTREEFPITGRLSGNWVIEGASDQGFVLAISSLVYPQVEIDSRFPPIRMIIFVSHYTFDQTGDLLWLTGSAEFQPGVSQVSIPVDEVNHGKFRSSQAAQRRAIGQITLTANNCNDITLEYDYNGLGLGSGSKKLQRLFSLETAGYDCRDYAARVEANQ